MGRHFIENKLERTLSVFCQDNGMREFTMGTMGKGPDATALLEGREVVFEIKAAANRVKDVSKSNGTRPGRFRIDPAQYQGYGTRWVWYVLVVYVPTGPKDGEIVNLNIIRSDQLPQRDTIISLCPSRVAGTKGATP